MTNIKECFHLGQLSEDIEIEAADIDHVLIARFDHFEELAFQSSPDVTENQVLERLIRTFTRLRRQIHGIGQEDQTPGNLKKYCERIVSTIDRITDRLSSGLT